MKRIATTLLLALGLMVHTGAAAQNTAPHHVLKGKVIDVVQTGYMLGERVLRFAKVVVGE